MTNDNHPAPEKTILPLHEKLGRLSPEQKKKLLRIKSGSDLDAVFSELGIEATAEEKAAVLEQVLSRELTDEEAEQTAGGAGFRLCPHGHFEATGFAHVGGATVHCEVDRCQYFTRTMCKSGDTSSGFISGISSSKYTYIERCAFFNREKERSYNKTDQKKTNG